MLRRLSLALLPLLVAAPALAQDPSVRLLNNTGKTITEIYASPSNQDDWGRDRLGNQTVAPGRRYTLRLTAGECRYDLRIVLRGGPPQEKRNVDLCRTEELAFGDRPGGGSSADRGDDNGRRRGGERAERGRGDRGGEHPTGNPSFNLVNGSQKAIRELYASPSSEEDWGSDRLGNETIAVGQAYPLRLKAGDCIYDVRVVYEGGRAEERRGTDLCAVTLLSFP